MSERLRLEYDDNMVDIVDKINVALRETGYQFVDDGKEHDGFIVLILTKE